ncbi:hypothetical protein GDO78_014890 [Eleutherodactylus coqui]|uniref:Uncharacterized protein n=1 Tax=Eleutherodactylus coqui TaxID=57060 RepID=A0A8J6BBY2_ELECQ|nr:hypothetical protein GDO78_014890 [Eleutherodactylus coqui]
MWRCYMVECYDVSLFAQVDLSLDVLSPSASQEDPMCKRLKTSERPEERSLESTSSNEGSGWKCVVL